MILSRRAALRGLFVAAPAIVAAPSLMRISTAALWAPPRHALMVGEFFGRRLSSREISDLVWDTILRNRGWNLQRIEIHHPGAAGPYIVEGAKLAAWRERA